MTLRYNIGTTKNGYWGINPQIDLAGNKIVPYCFFKQRKSSPRWKGSPLTRHSAYGILGINSTYLFMIELYPNRLQIDLFFVKLLKIRL